MHILIIEGQEEVRNRLALMLNAEYGYSVIAAVGTTEEALNILAFNYVGLVIMDLELHGLSAKNAVSALRTVCPDIKILVLSESDDDEKVFPVLKAGAIGYLLKDAHCQQIIAALEEIKAGGSPLSPSIAIKLLRNYQSLSEHAPPHDSPLTGRETEIMTMLYHGRDLEEIASALCISLHTIRVHTKKIYSKLNVNSRSHAVYQALRLKLIKP